MKVILNTDIPSLGEEGDVCDVAPGYARNYLLPRKMVLLDNKEGRSIIEGRRASIERRKEEKRKAALSTKERIESEALELKMPAGANGKLFGSVNSATIREALGRRGLEIDRKNIDIPERTIKATGNYRVGIRLYGGEVADLQVQVSPTGGQSAAAEKSADVAADGAEARGESAETAPEGAQTGGENAEATEADSEQAIGETGRETVSQEDSAVSEAEAEETADQWQ